jgi:hypothetical protein
MTLQVQRRHLYIQTLFMVQPTTKKHLHQKYIVVGGVQSIVLLQVPSLFSHFYSYQIHPLVKCAHHAQEDVIQDIQTNLSTKQIKRRGGIRKKKNVQHMKSCIITCCISESRGALLQNTKSVHFYNINLQVSFLLKYGLITDSVTLIISSIGTYIHIYTFHTNTSSLCLMV